MVAKGQSVAYVSQALWVSENLIYRWKQKAEGKEKFVLGTESSSLLVENQQLKERLRQVETEQDMDPMLTHVCGVKKSLSHFQPTDLR